MAVIYSARNQLINMKRLSAITLTLIIVYVVAGYYAAFECCNYYAYKHFKDSASIAGKLIRIDKSLITKDKTTFWEESDEFSYQGHMYDVVREDLQAYYCLSDDYENSLLDGLFKINDLEGDMALQKVIKPILFLKDYTVPVRAAFYLSSSNIVYHVFPVSDFSYLMASALYKPPCFS